MGREEGVWNPVPFSGIGKLFGAHAGHPWGSAVLRIRRVVLGGGFRPPHVISTDLSTAPVYGVIVRLPRAAFEEDPRPAAAIRGGRAIWTHRRSRQDTNARCRGCGGEMT